VTALLTRRSAEVTPAPDRDTVRRSGVEDAPGR